MSWHERWFYLDWARDLLAEAEEDNATQAFMDEDNDPRAPKSDLATFEALGADVQRI